MNNQIPPQAGLFEDMGLPSLPPMPSAPKDPGAFRPPTQPVAPPAPAPTAQMSPEIQVIMAELLRNPELAMQILQQASSGQGLPQPGQGGMPLPAPQGPAPGGQPSYPPMPTMPGKMPV